MEDCDAAQAAELVRALCEQVREMTAQLARIERQHLTGRRGRPSAMRMEAAALRRDIKEAQALIDRLQRRYLGRATNGLPRSQSSVSGGAAR
jgi:hypothetical protein